MQQTADGGHILAGYTGERRPRDMYLVKTDAHGDHQWSSTFGGANPDICYSVIQTTNGGYVLAGMTAPYGATEGDMYLIKTNTHGEAPSEPGT